MIPIKNPGTTSTGAPETIGRTETEIHRLQRGGTYMGVGAMKQG